MAQLSTEPQLVDRPAGPPPRRSAARRVPHAGALGTGVGLLALSTAIVLWARTRPGFDPYGWLVWGHQTLGGTLDTNAAPSWKPLPYVFTVPYALAGHDQLWLWMITAVAVALAGSIFAARIAHRLTAAPAGRRWAALAAGAFAGLALLEIQDWAHYVLSSQSDPMIVALCLAAIDAHLSGRPRLAFGLGVLAGLGRPEVWPFLALDALWLWFRVPRSRWVVLAGALVTLALWFGIPALTSRTPFVAASNAMGSGRRLRSDRVFGTVGRFLDMHELALELAALLSVALAVLRRDRTTLALAAGVCAWVVVEIAFALHGWPGLTRYMFEAGGVMVVVAAVGIGRVLAGPARLASPLGLAGVAVAVAVVAGLVPGAVYRVRVERTDLNGQHARTAEINRLATAIQRTGGRSRVLGCGEPIVLLEYQTVLAWTLRINVAKIGWKLPPALASGRPLVLFIPHAHGWSVKAVHSRTAACRGLVLHST